MHGLVLPFIGRPFVLGHTKDIAQRNRRHNRIPHVSRQYTGVWRSRSIANRLPFVEVARALIRPDAEVSLSRASQKRRVRCRCGIAQIWQDRRFAEPDDCESEFRVPPDHHVIPQSAC